MDSEKTVMVTGGLGFIGLHLVKRLLESHICTVVVVDNFSGSKIDADVEELQKKYGEKLSIVQGDLTRGDFPAVEVQEVYHLAAVRGTKYSNFGYDALKKNILMVQNLVEYFENKDVKIVFASTGEVFGGLPVETLKLPVDEKTPVGFYDVLDARWTYALGKIAGEMMIAHKVGTYRWSIARMQNPYGPRMGWDNVVPRFIRRLFEGEDPLKIETPDDTRPFTYIDDVVEGLVKIMGTKELDGQIVNLAGDEVKVSEMAEALVEKMGLGKVSIDSQAPDVKIERRCLDCSKIKSFGWERKISLKEGLDKTVEWYRKNFYNEK